MGSLLEWKAKHRLPKGFGSIRRLSGNRKNKYAVHPTMAHRSVTNENDGQGGSVGERRSTICYVPDWETGYKVLVLYNVGKYEKGMEKKLEKGTWKIQESGGCVERDPLYEYAVKIMEGIEIIRAGGDVSDIFRLKGTAFASVGTSEPEQEADRKSPENVSADIYAPEQEAGRKSPGNVSTGILAPEQEVNMKGKVTVSTDMHESQMFSSLQERVTSPKRTFSEIYESFYEWKFGKYARKQLTKDSENACRSAWLKLAPIYNKSMDEVSIDELEELVYEVANKTYSKTTVNRVATLIHQLYRYAYDRGYCERDYGKHVQMPRVKEEKHHQDFTDEELGKIWEAYRKYPDVTVKNVARMVLINCYSGFRIGEFEDLETVIGEQGYYQGGCKTEAGKNRIVPIHSAILPLVREILNEEGKPVFLCGKGESQFRREMKRVLVEIGVDESSERTDKRGGGISDPRYHTPHSCRHTFSRLCESYGVNEADRKRMMGHSLLNDVTNGVYGHRTVSELRRELEKITVL